MIALDTQILVYSQRGDSEWHEPALRCVRTVAEGDAPWAIAWPSIHEFLSTVTHRRIYAPPTPLADALAQVEFWMQSPTLRILGEGRDHWERLKQSAVEGKLAGPIFHDARIAAICQANGVRELWTADRDFSRFPSLRVRNPLVGGGA